MDYQKVELAEILLVGMEIRTNNEDEMNGRGKIANLGQRFYREGLPKIEIHVQDSIFAVYTDYELDETGWYTYFIGVKVSSLAEIPPGMKSKRIPLATYAKISTSMGKLPDVVIRKWQNIWADDSLKKKRAYTADLEIYDLSRDGAEQTEVVIYLAIKE